MEWQAWITVGVLALVIGLLTLTRVSMDLVIVGGLTLLLTFGVLRPEEALAGCANEGVITVGVLFVVAAGVRETGAMGLLAQWVLGRPRSLAGAQARMMLAAAAMSAFVYNTPLVATMLPVVNDWGKKHGLPTAKLMMPLSY